MLYDQAEDTDVILHYFSSSSVWLKQTETWFEQRMRLKKLANSFLLRLYR